MKYLTIVHKSKYGYDIHVPALPGCHSQGNTEKEALENIKDAIKKVKPFAVDINSGVESKIGRKDRVLIEQLMSKIKYI